MTILVFIIVMFHRLIQTFLDSVIHFIRDFSDLTSKKYKNGLLSFILEGETLTHVACNL